MQNQGSALFPCPSVASCAGWTGGQTSSSKDEPVLPFVPWDF
jgi:hypothetical protein